MVLSPQRSQAGDILVSTMWPANRRTTVAQYEVYLYLKASSRFASLQHQGVLKDPQVPSIVMELEYNAQQCRINTSVG